MQIHRCLNKIIMETVIYERFKQLITRSKMFIVWKIDEANYT